MKSWKKCGQVAKSCKKWGKLEKVGKSGEKWGRVGQIGKKWGKVGKSGEKWFIWSNSPPPPLTHLPHLPYPHITSPCFSPSPKRKYKFINLAVRRCTMYIVCVISVKPLSNTSQLDQICILNNKFSLRR